MKNLSLAGLVLLCASHSICWTQSPLLDGPDQTTSKPLPVQFLYPEQITIQASKSTAVDLHFRIRNGLHINSHTPHDKELIPTVLTLPAESGVKLEQAIYPAGTDIALAEDPGNKLNVYTGEFTIHAQIVVRKGDHLVEAKLRVQACTMNACMPPRTIPVAIDIVGQ